MFIDLLSVLTIIVGVIAFSIILYLRTGVRPSIRNSPVLLVQSTQGELINGHQGNTPAGIPYTYLLGSTSLFSSNITTGVIAVYLPFKTAAHLVGLPRSGNMMRVRSFNSVMEPVVLEGDYPNYFELFADRGQQADSRYVLDPKAMVFTIDFCKDVYWEISDSTLYFYGDGELPGFDIVDKFIEEIRPAVEVAASKDSSRLPYQNLTTTTLHCPICDAKLIDGEAWMECPKQHGLLITGRQMQAYREKAIRLDSEAVYQDGRTDNLKCPYCSQAMIPSRFQNTDITIDRCSKCIYRWIDKPEAAGILGVGSTK